MTERPGYFEKIRLDSVRRWNQLEADPELAGPWHQLFKQVQSPRHVLSELLQNADDAGATRANVEVIDGRFCFVHNGEDFTEEHFASLCGFGYSNKRALHTIGFRGIGFKSTFSLGSRVELLTPTLSIAFGRTRFTEPEWIEGPGSNDGLTHVIVEIAGEDRRRELEQNLAEWLRSPVSLLFFKQIRSIRIGDQEIHWESLGPGPVSNTEWMALHGNADQPFLVARSEEEGFPDEALAEIRQERLLREGEEADFPPSRVEIVLGAEGRLYVVLPTGVETELPFACNAPFIQDPARLKIKDPEISPTNRWLLAHVGSLAASTMLAWVRNGASSLAERAEAYGLFPDVDREDSSLEGVCGAIVERAFEEALGCEAFLLTDTGEVAAAKSAVAIPEDLFAVWDGDRVAEFFDDARRPAFSREVAAPDRKKLINWRLLDAIAKDHVLSVLQSKHLPRPTTWTRLLKLWAYIAPELTGYRHRGEYRDVRIVPVQGKDVLYAASGVVRLGEKRLLQSDADSEFFSKHLPILDPDWARFLNERRRASDDHIGRDHVEGALAVLDRIGLVDATEVTKVIEIVAKEVFGGESIALTDCIRLAQIAAKLGASAGESFRFATRDGRLRASIHGVVFDRDGTLEDLLPESWRAAHLLHPHYLARFESCTVEDWQRWVDSGRAGLLGFVPLIQTRSPRRGRAAAEAEVRRRGFSGPLTYPYVTTEFVVEDWDFEEIHWQHWVALAEADGRTWGRIVERILANPGHYGARNKTARVLQVATTGNTRDVADTSFVPNWILRLRDRPCLADTRGFHHRPEDLLRRTPETECFIEVEPFVHSRLDHESARPLLDLLGVRSAPTGPARLLDCLRALSKAEAPPTHEVDKWYRRLDQILETCSTEDLESIREAFDGERILLTENMGWSSTPGTFLLLDEEDVPGAAAVRASVRDLRLWRTLGVAERPTANLAIAWLRRLASGQAVPQEDLRRVKALLPRYPQRIWDECRHWLNLAGEWAPIGGLSYALSMQSLISWSHLHKWVKQKTADLQRVPADVTAGAPFSTLLALSTQLEERLERAAPFTESREEKAWLQGLAAELTRIELDDHAETIRIRELATRLAQTRWQLAPGLEVVPYIGGEPAGTPRRTDAAWLDTVLYVDQVSTAKLAKRVPEEIARLFVRSEIKSALDYAFERPLDEIRAYLEENFKLSARGEGKGMEAAGTERHGSENRGDAVLATKSPESLSPTEEAHSEASGAEAAGNDAGADTAATNEGSAEQIAEGGTRGTGPAAPRAAAPRKPTIMERFARAKGFQRDGENRFLHADGSRIAKSDSGGFWERISSSGELLARYWAKDHCLEKEPLQLEFDVWGLIDRRPELYGLILSSLDGDPVEFTGIRLRELRNAERLTIHPATYRLVLEA